MGDGKVLRRQEGHDSETVEEEEVAHRPVSGVPKSSKGRRET
jgi:hypothetical protein